jgi:hypothetical protein
MGRNVDANRIFIGKPAGVCLENLSVDGGKY